METRETPAAAEEPLRLKADWKIYLPAIVVGMLYGGLWLLLAALGGADSGLARAVLLVAGAGTPLLLLHAWLRSLACELRLSKENFSYRQGWLRSRWHHVPLETVTGARVVHGPAGRLLGNGALIVSLSDGSAIRLADIAGAEEAAGQITLRSRALRERMAEG